jgi:hypothetical protein
VWVVLVELVVVRVAVVVVGGHGELEVEGRWLGEAEMGVGWWTGGEEVDEQGKKWRAGRGGG